MSRQAPTISREKAAELLGTTPEAGDEPLRAAYLEQVRLHPPDREPELFEQIRDAYDQLRDPASRARLVLEGPDPSEPLPNLLDGYKARRVFVGSALWLELLKEKRS